MDDTRVHEYYEMLRFFYLKPDSDWSDKAKSIRTIAHDFYNEISRSYGSFADALKEFYKWSRYNEVSKAAFYLKDKLNEIVHQNKQIDKRTYLLYYNMLVRLIYLATGVLPDDATLEFIGCKVTSELEGLNDEQKDAVICDEQIVYVNAGPGTGKTHLLINKLLRYISISQNQEKIVALSYTNTAARELGERFRRDTFNSGINKPYDFYNGTLHSFCFKMIKSFYAGQGKDFNYIIIDDTDIDDLAEEFRIQLNDKYGKEDIKACLKSRLQLTKPDLQKLVSELKDRYSIISIDDILTQFIDELNNTSFRTWIKDKVTVLVIDEAQDLSNLNYRIFDLLLEVNPEIKMFLVGDPRQNIFGFNGGSYVYLNRFLARHSNYTRKNLTGTYRCPQPICDYVNTFHFTDCENIPLHCVGGTTGQATVRVADNVDDEAEIVLKFCIEKNDLQHTAVLCQNLKYLGPFIALLGRRRIPYKVFGGQKLVKKHVKLFNHFLRIIDNDNLYSINVVSRWFRIDLNEEHGKNRVERFYNTKGGKTLAELKRDIARRKDEITLKAIVSTVVDEFFSNVQDSWKTDFESLKTLSAQYSTISDFLLAFAIDRDTFAPFIEKNYVECKVPVTDNYLTVSTIHSAKGLEWNNVAIMGMSEGNFPNMWFAKDYSDEKKAAYLNDLLKSMFVAATRTKGDLMLTYAKKNPWGYAQTPSRFIKSLF